MTNSWTMTTPEGRAWKQAYERQRYWQNPDKPRRKAWFYRRNKRAWALVSAARRRAVSAGIAFDLDDHREDLQKRIDAGHCELTGISFNLDGGRTFDSPSLDRIDPNKGYVYDNMRVICDLMNRALSDWGEEPFRIVAEAYLLSRKRSNS